MKKRKIKYNNKEYSGYEVEVTTHESSDGKGTYFDLNGNRYKVKWRKATTVRVTVCDDPEIIQMKKDRIISNSSDVQSVQKLDGSYLAWSDSAGIFWER